MQSNIILYSTTYVMLPLLMPIKFPVEATICLNGYEKQTKNYGIAWSSFAGIIFLWRVYNGTY